MVSFSRGFPGTSLQGRWGSGFSTSHPICRLVLAHRIGKNLLLSPQVSWGSPGPALLAVMKRCSSYGGAQCKKLLTIFCWTKRGERNSAHSRPCRDSAFLRGIKKWQRESVTQAINPLGRGKPHPPGSEDEKCDPGSSPLPLLDPNQRLWEVNQRAFPKFRGPWFGHLLLGAYKFTKL